MPVLTACANQSSSTETSSSNKVLIEVDKVENVDKVEKSEKVEKEEEGGLSQKEFEEFAAASLKELDPKTVTEARIAPATNGVMKTSIDGKEKIDYRTYSLPSDWELHSRTIAPERDVVYMVDHGGLDYIVMLYPLDAYASSPLDGGDYLTDN